MFLALDLSLAICSDRLPLPLLSLDSPLELWDIRVQNAGYRWAFTHICGFSYAWGILEPKPTDKGALLFQIFEFSLPIEKEEKFEMTELEI